MSASELNGSSGGGGGGGAAAGAVGAAVGAAANGGGGGSSLLVSHACQFCRKRKIKCDRLAGGCTHCKRISNECIYPASQRKGRPRHGPNNAAGKTSAFAITSREARLLARIRELEGMLNQNADGGGASPGSDTSSSRPADALNTISQGMDNLLVIDKKADYTDEAFWANLGVEIGYKGGPLDSELESDDDDDPATDTPLAAYSPSQSYISSSSIRKDLAPLHPPPSMIAYLWDAYVKNAEPILGLFHKPTIGRIIMSAQSDRSTLSSGDEVLLFSIYFAGLRTLTDEDIHLKFGADRTFLLEQFRSGIERGLAKADYLKPKGIASLQALTLYLVCLRYFEAPSMVWGLTGLALRIAQYMGLHRDGTNSKSMSPLEIEIRRRLWHQICLIDVRAAETLGFAPSNIETDTRVPLNIDDADISAESESFPKPRTGMTEMSLAIMRIKFGIVYRRLISTRHVLTLAERVKMVEDYEQAMHREFLESRKDSEFIRNIADTAIKSLMWLGIYREERTLSQADKDHLFISAIQVIEMTHELHRDSGSKRWSWLFTSLIQYHAMTFTLGELCVRPPGEETERAWRALENSIHPWAVAEQGQKHLFQNVVRKLYTKAQKRRQMQDGQRYFSYDTPPEQAIMPGPPLTTMAPTYSPVTTVGGNIPSMTDMPPMFIPFPQSALEPDFVTPEGMAVPFPVQPIPHGAQIQNVPHDWAIWHDAFRGSCVNPNGEMYGNQQTWYPH